ASYGKRAGRGRRSARHRWRSSGQLRCDERGGHSDPTALIQENCAMNEFDFRIEGRVAKIVLDRPDNQNLLSRDLLLSLRTVASDLAADPDIQVLTIVGKGTECFSTGILTPALREQLAKEEVLKLIRLANETFDAIEALPQIVI